MENKPVEDQEVQAPAKANINELEKSRNISSSEPESNEELADNMAGADSGIEKPAGQEK